MGLFSEAIALMQAGLSHTNPEKCYMGYALGLASRKKPMTDKQVLRQAKKDGYEDPDMVLFLYNNAFVDTKENPRLERLPGRNLGYGTNNGGMAKNQLRTIKRTSIELHDAIRDADELPDWVLSKITVAQDRLSVATDYILSKLRAMELEAQGHKMNPFVDEDPLYVQDEVDYAKDVIDDIGMAKMRKAQEKLDRLIYVYASLINAVDVRKMRRVNQDLLRAIQSGKVREDLLKKAKHFTDQFYVVDEEFSSEDSWEEEYSSEE